MTKAKQAVPEGYHTITPQLTLDDAPSAIEWYQKALGAEELGRSTGPMERSCTPNCASAIRASWSMTP